MHFAIVHLLGWHTKGVCCILGVSCHEIEQVNFDFTV